jgi:hypothetical protein
MVLGKVCLPGDDVARTATVTATPQSADTRYQAAQLLNPDRAYVCRSTGTGFDLLYVFDGGAKTAIRVSVHNTNATSVKLSNGAGLDLTVPLQPPDPDGQRVDVHIDLSEEENTTDTAMIVRLEVGAGIVECGNVAIWAAEHDVNWEAGRDEGILRPGNSVMATRLGSEVHDDQGIRRLWYDMTFSLLEDLDLWRTLDMSSKGAILPFPLVPDVEEPNAIWARCPEEFQARRGVPGFAGIPRRFVEVSGGPPNG